jgi:hypothetical protein
MMQRKQFLRFMGAALGWGAIAPMLNGCVSEEAPTDTATTPTTPVTPTTSTLSAEEIAGLKFMREEEKLAHDVYIFLYARWGNNVFSNIADSETTHTEAILALLVKYGIPDPAAGKPAGVFEDPALQTLYDTLIVMGSFSQIEALKVGALIEETDIRDIHLKEDVTDEPDILSVYANLLCGSQNHLQAYNSALLKKGVTYVPQVITQAEWDAIVNSTTCVVF